MSVSPHHDLVQLLSFGQLRKGVSMGNQNSIEPSYFHHLSKGEYVEQSKLTWYLALILVGKLTKFHKCLGLSKEGWKNSNSTGFLDELEYNISDIPEDVTTIPCLLWTAVLQLQLLVASFLRSITNKNFVLKVFLDVMHVHKFLPHLVTEHNYHSSMRCPVPAMEITSRQDILHIES